MELVINLTHDCREYCRIDKEGILKDENLFGYRSFSITELRSSFEIDFWNEDNTSYWTYKCVFTDHGNRLVVTV